LLDVERTWREWMVSQPGVTALTGARVYAGRDVPPVGYRITDGACVVSKARPGRVGYEGALYSVSFQVKAYGATEAAAMALYRAMYDALEGSTSARILHVELEGPGMPMEEPETLWPFVLSYWTVMMREVW
jgi:hypothetical protein